ncbi:MAG: 3-deoxy-7-phosphoheptulonate synthase, partial [Gemmatimonadales bacterium]
RSVLEARQTVRRIIRGADSRRMCIVGPCSIHDPAAALDYAERLARLRAQLGERLFIVMRVYFEKPRTTVGWKGLINDPHLNGSHDIATGLRVGRKLLLDLASMGVPTGTEMLDPIIPQYLADLVTWAAIGARTTESQTHREMASGLSMPVGYKNGTDGGLAVAVNAVVAASRPHSFLGIDGAGRVSIVRTAGNPDGHIVLRGGKAGPNYASEQVAEAAAVLRKAGIESRMLIDCSHDNSGKSHLKQRGVIDEVAHQIENGSPHVLGAMIESNLVAGRQELNEGATRGDLVYGQSITDACVDLATTADMLGALAGAVSASRGKRRVAE